MRDHLACAVTVLLLLSPPAGVHTVDASDQLQRRGNQWSFQDGVSQCISGVATLPRVEAYRKLCSDIESLYAQNQQSASTILGLQVLNANMRAQAVQLRDHELATNTQIQTEEQQLQATATQIHHRALVLDHERRLEERMALAKHKREERRTSLLERALRATRQTEQQQVSEFQRKERELELVKQQTMMLRQQAEEEVDNAEEEIAKDEARKNKEIREVHEMRAQIKEERGALKSKWELQWAQTRAALEPKLIALESENAALRKELAEIQVLTGNQNLKGSKRLSLLEQLRALQTENAQLVQQCG